MECSAAAECKAAFVETLHTRLLAISRVRVLVCEPCTYPCMFDVHIVHWFEFQLARANNKSVHVPIALVGLYMLCTSS